MTEFLLGLNLLLLLGVLAFLIVLAKRRAGGDAQAENDLRTQVAARDAQVAELRGQVAAVEKQAAGLHQQLQAEHGARVGAEARLQAERQSFEEQRAMLVEDQAKLKVAFAALSAEALKDSRTEFLIQADEKLKPIQKLLGDYEGHLRKIEEIRSDAYGGLKAHLDTLAQAHQVLQKEAHQLSTALRSPTVRGRWGEMTLRRVVEVAGMSPHCDFEEQASTTTEEGRLQPDMKIKLPGSRAIVVDSKVPLAGYMDALEAKDEAARQAALGRHAQQVRSRVQELSKKAYWDQFDGAAEFVVLFLPGESFFSAALEQDRSLMEDAMQNKVFLATPTTLMALLNVVAHGWRQQEMAENAERIGQAGKELFERLVKFVEHFSGIGDGLRRAVKAYDGAVGSYEARIQPAARRLADQAAIDAKELPEVPAIDGPTRMLGPAEESKGVEG
ncbi:MAG: DNA recombination protein RmuC [Planctomycetota bacterium]|nr:DNA recombination protein RmuC [Planctomycetota bacterium]